MTAGPDADLERVIWSIVRQLGPRASVAGPGPTADLVRLVLQFWPHRRLSELARSSRHHAGVAQAGAATRARARETWEARHGDEAWCPALAAAGEIAWECLLDLWLVDAAQRAAFVEHSRRLAGGGR